jgi:hypothetical protein
MLLAKDLALNIASTYIELQDRETKRKRIHSIDKSL